MTEVVPVGGHFTAPTSAQSVHVVIQPEAAAAVEGSQSGVTLEPSVVEPALDGEGRLPRAVAADAGGYGGMSPLPWEPQGYVHVMPLRRQSDNSDPFDAGLQISSHQQMPHYTAEEQLQQQLPEAVREEDVAYIRENNAAADSFKGSSPSMTASELEALKAQLQDANGNFLAMTACGPVALPKAMTERIPEKLSAPPLMKERDIFVRKREEQTRVSEQEFTQFEYLFNELPQILPVDDVEVEEEVITITVPRCVYKPVIEDKVTEIIRGVKYVEIPIEVELQSPDRLVPVPKPYLIERVIKVVKPVVQEKIVEVPDVVQVKVPQADVVNIPYIVPSYKYIDVDVPFEEGGRLPTPRGAPMTVIPLPPPTTQVAPRATADTPPPPGTIPLAPTPLNSLEMGPPAVAESGSIMMPQQQHAAAGVLAADGHTSFASSSTDGPEQSSVLIGTAAPAQHAALSSSIHVEGDSLYVAGDNNGQPTTFYMTPGIRHVQLGYEASIQCDIVQEREIPPGAPIAQPGVRYMAPGNQSMAYQTNSSLSGPNQQQQELSPDEPLFAGPMEPIVTHGAPGFRATEFVKRGVEPDVLTRSGVMKLGKFQYCLRGDGNQLLPSLAPHPEVPMRSNGAPDLRELARMHTAMEACPTAFKIAPHGKQSFCSSGRIFGGGAPCSE